MNHMHHLVFFDAPHCQLFKHECTQHFRYFISDWAFQLEKYAYGGSLHGIRTMPSELDTVTAILIVFSIIFSK